MNIAVISFDQDFINQIKRELPGGKIRGYIDSLSMLKELSEFNPDVIIYDASSGEFAIDDLKFLLTRDKVEKKKFRVLLSKEQPVDIDSFPEVEDIIYYTKETDINKLVEDIRIETGIPAKETVIEEPAISTDNMENFFESSTFGESLREENKSDFVDHLDEFSISKEEEKEIKESLEFLDSNTSFEMEEKKETPSLESVEKDMSISSPEELDTFSFEETFSQQPEEKETPQEKFISEPLEEKIIKPKEKQNVIKIEIDISIDDIKQVIAEKAVQQLIKEVLKSPEMEELVNNIQRDFVQRTEEELDKIKEDLKKELKEKLISSVESELKESLVETIKEDVAKLTAQMVKEKLEQLFGGR